MRKCSFILFIFLIINSCVSFKLNSFYSNSPIEKKLPPLKIKQSFKIGYRSETKTYLVIRDPKTGEMVLYDPSFFKKEEDQTYKNRIQDAFLIVNEEINKNICTPSIGMYYGTIECQITNLKNETDTGLSVISMLTLYTINLLGFPIASQLSIVKVSFKIFNCNNVLVKDYTAKGIGKAYSAMYWGYPYFGYRGGTNRIINDKYPVSRAAHAKAVADAIQKIKQMIKHDTPQLLKFLKKSCK